MYRMRPPKKIRRKISQNTAARTGTALALMKRHNKIYSIKNDFVGETAIEALSLLTEASFNELYMNSFSNSRLSVHDDYLIGTYSRLMKGYGAIINYYSSHEGEISDQHSKTILRGIRTIFYTRISEYRESEVESLAEEKNEQANKYLGQFSSEAQKLVAGKFPEFLSDTYNLHDDCMWDMTEEKSQDISHSIANEVIRVFSKDIYNIYKNCSYKAMNESIKNKARDRINNCFERIKQEYDILGAVVKIQAPELEIRNSKHSVVNKLLSMVREHYQKLGSDINHIEALYRQAELGDSAKDDLYTFISRVGVFINSKETLSDIKDKYICEYVFLEDDFDQGVKACLMKNSMEKLALQRPEILSPSEKKNILFTGELVNSMIAEFKAVINYADLNKNKYQGDEKYSQIIAGICETLDIKIQSIDEMHNEYADTTGSVLMKRIQPSSIYGVENVLKDIEEFNREYKQNYKSYFNDGKQGVKVIDSFLRKAAGKIKVKAIAESKKIIEVDRNNIIKFDYQFKKDCVFFEMVTFEEILNYSVSKLRESGQVEILEFANAVSKANDNIRLSLAKCGIEIINPIPHEIFNGRIHEVLMAKTEDGYKKGEIIKALNNGYKQGSVIFARANVICAK